MHRTAVAFAAVVVFGSALSGCDAIKSISLSAEEKINAAYPLSDNARAASAAVLQMLPEAQRKELEGQLESRMKLRALSCAKGYSPSWLTSARDIRNKLNNPACFTEADIDIGRWLGIRRIGLVLAQPPLRPIPAKAPEFIIAGGFLQFARFASNAGVALVRTSESVEVLDFESQKPIFREVAEGHGSIGFLSANGRLFSVSDGNQVRLRDSESGAVLLELPARHYEFHLLDDKTAVYSRSDNGKVYFVDWSTGRETQAITLTRGIQRAFPVPGVENQYVLFTPKGATRIKVVRDKADLELNLEAEQEIPRTNWSVDGAQVSADGKLFYSGSQGLTIVSLETLQFEAMTLAPFNLSRAIATPDPDQIVLHGHSTYTPDGAKDYIYSIGNRTLASIDKAQVSAQRMQYIPSLRKNATLADNRITVLENLPVTVTVSLAQFTSEMTQMANERMLDNFEKQQAARRQEAQLAQAPGGGPPAKAQIPNLAPGSRVEAIGVYQSGRRERSASTRSAGNVVVRVRRSAQPLILVLSSYEPVLWVLMPEQGATLSAVIVSGVHESKVFGHGNARVVVAGRNYAYKAEGNEYNALNRDVQRLAGKPIDLFQGQYEGTMFTAGGR